MEKDKKKILKQLWAIATADTAKVFSLENGNFTVLPIEQWSAKTRLAVASVEKSAGGIKVKFYDKLKALELLGKHLGLFEPAFQPDENAEGLLQQLLIQTKKEAHFELQSETNSGNDLVEPAGIQKP